MLGADGDFPAARSKSIIRVLVVLGEAIGVVLGRPFRFFRRAQLVVQRRGQLRAVGVPREVVVGGGATLEAAPVRYTAPALQVLGRDVLQEVGRKTPAAKSAIESPLTKVSVVLIADDIHVLEQALVSILLDVLDLGPPTRQFFC